MLTELYGKGGKVCQPAREGKLRCPLIVRPTSEDVITGHLCLVLRALNPRWWLPDLLNTALKTNRFRRQVFRDLRIEPWKNFPKYPVDLLPWNEGSTQVDLVISWENPPTTIFIEAKYLASLSTNTANDNGQHGYPSDQLIRNIRVGLWTCRWLERRGLFSSQPRDFGMILLSPKEVHPLISKYQDPRRLREAIPKSGLLQGLPPALFIGQLTYRDVIRVLRQNQRWYSRSEQVLIESLTDYLIWKTRKVSKR